MPTSRTRLPTARTSGIATEPGEGEFSSPACSMHEAPDAYMGYADTAELTALLNELLDTERALSGVLRERLPRVRSDHLRAELTGMLKTHEGNIATLHALLQNLGKR
ncbi:MAG TPA: hypothetical protein VK437_17150 [Steroidobacteraceae bacterium]|nr:hypothetical protein [Steroidobacteraceae bacterium]